MDPVKPGAHVRQHRSLLAGPEKRLLIWIAARLPRSINSDHLSGLALAAMAAAGYSFAVLQRHPWAPAAVVLALVVNWFGDSLDGTVARVRNQQRPRYGFYVDHVIDLAGTAMLLAGIACSGVMTPGLALALLAAYQMVTAESFLAVHAAGVFRLSFLGFGPTELRILLAVGAVKVAGSPWAVVGTLGTVRLFDVGGVVAIVALTVAFVVAAWRNGHELFMAEPLVEGASTRPS
jgi:archaetidylinositol phosphate synthase